MRWLRRIMLAAAIFTELESLRQDFNVVKERLRKLAQEDPIIGPFIARVEAVIEIAEEGF